jgi:hypothetical protein
MSTLEVLALVIIVAVVLVWRITWLANRVNRATVRAERTWSVLDAALAGRAQRAAELVMMPGIDPATALLVLDAAAAALEPELRHGERERAESDLSHVLDLVDYTTMLWPRPFRCAADTRYESCGWPGVPSSRVRSKWQKVCAPTTGPPGFASANRENARSRELGWPRER